MIPDPLGQAVRWLGSGGLLAYPTETVWGLAADASSEAALERMRRWKRRAADEPVAVLVEDVDDAEAHGFAFGPAAQRLAAALWPGPLTLIVPGGSGLAAGVARGDGAVGLRCSSHPLARALARRLRRDGVGPITATSLNRSGSPPACSRDQAQSLCGEGPDEPRMIEVEGAEAGGDAASTVIDTTVAVPRVLRWGSLRQEDLRPLLEAWSES